MRKQTKIAAVVSAAALLALGASMTSFAASKGTWMMVDGEWYCYDKNGDAYENVFCSSNGKEYYVGDDGQLVRSEWVDYDGSYYFVNSSGAKITNDWRLTTPYDDDTADEEWYYFKSNGKRAENEKITYKGKTYYFDTDGKMLTGWVTTGDSATSVNEATGYEKDHTFYCDETGARVEGAWVKNTEPGTDDDDADADEYWYYLKSSGKVANGKQSNVKGQGFVFGNKDDNFGQMLTNWVGGTKDGDSYKYEEIGGEDSVAQLSDYASNGVVYYCMYDEDKADGHIQKNKWRKTWRPEDAYEEDEDEDKYWYWLEKDGKAYIPDSDDMKATGYAYDLGDGALEVDGSQFSFAKKKINSKDYFFNADGEMLSDFVNVVHTEDANVIDLGMYYFGGSSDGSMKTGSQTVKDDNGDSFKFYFGTKDNNTTGEAKGKGVTGNKNNKLYYMGHLVAAEDYKYQPVWYDMDNNGEDDTLFIVNQNGSIQHSALEYKEDGDILIDAKTNKVAFKTKNTKDNVWDKYSVLDEENADKLIINVEVLDEKVVMPINEVYDPATPDDASPANAQ